MPIDNAPAAQIDSQYLLFIFWSLPGVSFSIRGRAADLGGAPLGGRFVLAGESRTYGVIIKKK
jgi:hypothetical protein